MTDKATLDNERKQFYLNSVAQFYSQIIGLINTLNVHPIFKSHCFQNLDQSHFWAQKGIEMMQFPDATSAPVPPPQAPANDSQEGASNDKALNSPTE